MAICIIAGLLSCCQENYTDRQGTQQEEDVPFCYMVTVLSFYKSVIFVIYSIHFQNMGAYIVEECPAVVV